MEGRSPYFIKGKFRIYEKAVVSSCAFPLLNWCIPFICNTIFFDKDWGKRKNEEGKKRKKGVEKARHENTVITAV